MDVDVGLVKATDEEHTAQCDVVEMLRVVADGLAWGQKVGQIFFESYARKNALPRLGVRKKNV